MTVRVAINGFGRIGRLCLRAALSSDSGVSIVAVNDLADAPTLMYLARRDSVRGPLAAEVVATSDGFRVNDQEVRVFSESDPAQLDWSQLGVDVVIEATGVYTDARCCRSHLERGARKVLISALAVYEDLTVVMGVNHAEYNPRKHAIISAASCTTNCLAPLAAVLDAEFGIVKGTASTIHAYTTYQNLLDDPHVNMYRARAAAINIIPMRTGASAGIGAVLPHLEGLIQAHAMRVPVAAVSLLDFTVELRRSTTQTEVNSVVRAAAEGRLKGILTYTAEPLVSTDFIGDPASCVFDAGMTRVLDDLVKVLAWYDNEWAYVHRLIELAAYVGAPT